MMTPKRLQEIFGGNAVSDEYGIGRHVANLFVTQTYEGQSDIHSKSWEETSISFAKTCFRFDPWKSHNRYSSFCMNKLELFG